MRQRLLREWVEFSIAIGLETAPDVQRTEMRRAFYAGARVLLTMLMSQLSPSDEATQEDEDMLKDVDAELAAFNNDVRAGRA